MEKITRLPAIPLICSDPYISFWMPADTMTQTDAIHWCGPQKPIKAVMTVDGKSARFLGTGEAEEAKLTELSVTPNKTRFVSEFGGVAVETSFITPDLPDDLDLLSMPVTFVKFSAKSLDGKKHELSLKFHLSDKICYDGDIRPEIYGDTLDMGVCQAAFVGQSVQKPLCHSGDHITIDWGFLYLCGDKGVQNVGDGVVWNWQGDADSCDEKLLIAYDDIASINYFGDLCKAWYRRNGLQITDAIKHCINNYDDIVARCEAMDEKIIADAKKVGSEAYVELICAAWRHTWCAHKLIATPKGEMALLSKENDSNGCIGTVDVSYPSIPMFLKYCPELVNALCRPILEFASMPVWTDDFAPHDVGRYPYATGQVYGAIRRRNFKNGEVYPMFYLYPETKEVYDLKYQMPVEECGNMLVMLAAAGRYGADKSLAENYRGLLDKWVKYLIEYGEDPGEQLCTDDFAGHLAHNVNLAAKAIVGVACYGMITGDDSWLAKAKEMAARFLEKIGDKGNTPLTLDGQGWSMKYNLMWDKVFGLGLLPEHFYANETASYLSKINKYGLPLDSRADYTKSDWICWTATMADDPAVRDALFAPIARMLRETQSRVPFSDWYFTSTGLYRAFIARSVQGGLFAPMLRF